MKRPTKLGIISGTLLTAILLTGCIDGSGSNSSGSAPPSSSEPTSWYMAVRAVDDEGQQGPYSNEVSGQVVPGQTVTLAWNAPNTALDGTCKVVGGYLIEMGTSSGVYTHSQTVQTNNTGLSCYPTGSNFCGNTYTCEVGITVPNG